MSIYCVVGLGDKSHLRGDDSVVFYHRRRCRRVLQVRRVDLLRFHLLLLHHSDDHRFRRYGRATEGQRAEPETRIRDVRLNIHPLRLGDRGGFVESASPEIRDDEHGGRETR